MLAASDTSSSNQISCFETSTPLLYRDNFPGVRLIPTLDNNHRLDFILPGASFLPVSTLTQEADHITVFLVLHPQEYTYASLCGKNGVM